MCLLIGVLVYARSHMQYQQYQFDFLKRIIHGNHFCLVTIIGSLIPRLLRDAPGQILNKKRVHAYESWHVPDYQFVLCREGPEDNQAT